jgi:formylmethanofuran dehydrogenase subunit A
MAGNKTLAIKNGYVFDPLNEIDGEIMDIFVKDGKVVRELSGAEMKNTKVIDAKGMTVMPGGVDSHSHIAGAKVNGGRMMRPEDSYRWSREKTPLTHSGTGYTVPSVYLEGYQYSQMGYTTAFEAAVPPLEARHTHEEMRSIPMIDTGGYLVLGNNWFMMRYLRDGDIERAANYVAWMMKTHKAYGIKCVNPAGVENWGWAEDIGSLDEANIHFGVTPRDMIQGLCEINEILGLPMSMHLHCNNLGQPGCFEITKNSIEIPSQIKANQNLDVEWAETKLDPKRKQSVYLTHAQFNSFGGTSWGDFESGTKAIIDHVNKTDYIVMDSGCVPFGEATVMTGDGPAIHNLYKLTGNKWSNTDVEMECGSGILPFTYLKSNPIHSVQWAMGLELLLLVKDVWKSIMTTDHPNGGTFLKYPQIISWLMSQRAREDTFNECHKWARDRSDLGAVDREMSLYDIAVLTRANPARTVGISHRKGSLGVGADGDVTIYNIDPTSLDTRDYGHLVRNFSKAEYTIKDGEIVSRQGEIVAIPQKRTYYTDVTVNEQGEKDMLADVKEWFKYYTVGFAHYPTPDSYLMNPTPIKINAEE